MFPNFNCQLKEIPVTAKDMMTAYVAAAKKKEVEDYVEEVLEDMSEDDLYCNFRMSGEDILDFTVNDSGDLSH